jgi:hypothetical protein
MKYFIIWWLSNFSSLDKSCSSIILFSLKSCNTNPTYLSRIKIFNKLFFFHYPSFTFCLQKKNPCRQSHFLESWLKIEKKGVAYPQEDFLFTILDGDSWRPPKKYIKYPKSKKTKIHIGSIRQSLRKLNPKT